MSKGLFVTIEGGDGSGKTTALDAICAHLCQKGVDFIRTREPGGSVIAEQIRQVILNPANTAEDSRTEALLYAASRRQHLVEIILPALAENKLVLCDRFIDSSVAYQGYGRGLPVDDILAINQFALQGRMPDKTLYFDVDPTVGLQRVKKRSNLDRLDQETLAFHKRVHDGYAKIVAQQPQRFIVIDAQQTAAQVASQACQIIEELLHDHV